MIKQTQYRVLYFNYTNHALPNLYILECRLSWHWRNFSWRGHWRPVSHAHQYSDLEAWESTHGALYVEIINVETK